MVVFRDLRTAERPSPSTDCTCSELGLNSKESGRPGWNRTSNPQLRRLMLYPIELRPHALGWRAPAAVSLSQIMAPMRQARQYRAGVLLPSRLVLRSRRHRSRTGKASRRNLAPGYFLSESWHLRPLEGSWLRCDTSSVAGSTRTRLASPSSLDSARAADFTHCS